MRTMPRFYESHPAGSTDYDSNLPSLVTGNDPAPSTSTPAESKRATKPKRKRSKKEQVNVNDEFRDPDLNMSTSPEAPRSSTKKKRKKNSPISSESSRKPPKIKGKKAQEPQSPSKSRKAKESPLPPGSIIGKACIRCREKQSCAMRLSQLATSVGEDCGLVSTRFLVARNAQRTVA